MAGWNLKCGSITEYYPNEDGIWSLFNYVFSDSSRKRNTYKFGLIKSLLDNAFNGKRPIRVILSLIKSDLSDFQRTMGIWWLSMI